MSVAIKELESLSEDLGAYETKKEGFRVMLAKYTKRADDAAKKMDDCQVCSGLGVYDLGWRVSGGTSRTRSASRSISYEMLLPL